MLQVFILNVVFKAYCSWIILILDDILYIKIKVKLKFEILFIEFCLLKKKNF